MAGAVLIHVLRTQLYASKLAGVNAAAARDTTVRILLGAFASSRRQVQQLTVTLDRRTHEDDERGVALTQLALRFDSVRASTVGTAETLATGALRVHGELDAWDSAGIRVRAAAELALVSRVSGVQPATDGVRWDWKLDRRPLEITVDFSCRRDTALVHVAGPPWARATVDRAVQTPDVCNPRPRWQPFQVALPSVPVAAAFTLLGWLLHP